MRMFETADPNPIDLQPGFVGNESIIPGRSSPRILVMTFG
jgi:hypothetical protein